LFSINSTFFFSFLSKHHFTKACANYRTDPNRAPRPYIRMKMKNIIDNNERVCDRCSLHTKGRTYHQNRYT
jgi:hypothetical protein